MTILHKYILGCVWLDEEMMEDSFSWVGHWALTFKNKANDTVINAFLNRYRGSEEEAADIKQLYSICAKHSFHLILSGPWYPGRQGMKQIEPATPRILYFFYFSNFLLNLFKYFTIPCTGTFINITGYLEMSFPPNRPG